ncbi:uncharacterized protein LOC141853215 [Brevipalpus obovatus]|uniref:uncharacterized protein LOC141853215 n=1 Tax=Brevipalpus obovatus TaxID=246614 RepID=UPI003D9EB5C2
MAFHILGMGIGLFMLLVLWTSVIVVVLITSRAKEPYSRFGPIALLIAIMTSSILILFPREKQEGTGDNSTISSSRSELMRKKIISDLEPPHDWMLFWRFIIIWAHFIAIVISLTAVFYLWVMKSFTNSSLQLETEMKNSSKASEPSVEASSSEQ